MHRQRIAALMLVTALFAAACDSGDDDGSADPSDAVDTETVAIPTIGEPLTGDEMQPDPLLSTSDETLAELDYTVDEYLVSGTADDEPYTTRIAITGPDDPSDFSGTVLLESKHATGIPFVWSFTQEYLASEGHAAVEVIVFPNTVERWVDANPERYGELALTEEQESDVLAQVGALLKSDTSPLVDVETLVMTGHSMASGPVWRYMDTHHNHVRLDGGDPIYDGFFPETTRTASRMGPFPEVDVPTLLINSELEVQAVLIDDGVDYRRPDSDEEGEQFRLYEIAGMPHNPAWMHPNLRPILEDTCDRPLNSFPYDATVSMALSHLLAWINDGTSPPRAERVELEGEESAPTAVARDEHGNAVGGVRSTTLDLPVATHTGTNTGEGFPGIGDCLVYGSQVDFDTATLVDLYGTHDAYVEAVEERLDELIEEGWVLELFAEAFLEDARDFDGFDR